MKTSLSNAWRRLLAVLCLAAAAWPAWGQLEIIPLRNRTAEELLPILRPLVEPGGVLTGTQYQLILRASPANAADIRRVLATLDTAVRRLVISVRQDAYAGQQARGAAVSGSIGSTGASVGVRIDDRQSASQDRVSQSVQVLEGGIAAINVGQAVPVRGQVVTRTVNGVVVQDTTSYREVGTGFQVRPRLSGPPGNERVTLEINPRRDTPGPGGSVNVQGAYTTVSARLGEWMEIGGSNISDSRSGSGILAGGQAQRNDNRSIWVKVEELK